VAEPIVYLVDRTLREELELLTQPLIKGDCVDFADYKYLAGQIRGIQFAIQALEDMRRRIAKEQGDLEP